MKTRSLIFASVYLAFGASTNALAQNAGNMINIFMEIMHATMVDHARTEWTKVSQNELSCIEQGLDQQGTSINNLIQNGVDPNDARISNIRSGCKPQKVMSPAPVPNTQRTQEHEQRTPYIVDGIVLGGRIQLDDDAYKKYQCEPSQQYPGFTRCGWDRSPDDSDSMLHAPDGTVMYVNRYIELASFKPNEINTELDRLTQKFGTSPKLIRMPHRPDLPDAFIAIWGDLNLQPLDQDSMSTLASGGSPGKGMLVDFLGHFSRSARSGLPVYSVSGGAGYVWSVSYDKKGKGTLRFFAMDPSALTNTSIAQVPTGGNSGDTTQPQASQPPKDTPRLKEARIFLEDARKFLAGQKSVPSISAIGNEGANLQIAIDKFDEAAAVKSMAHLTELLKSIDGFEAFEKQQQADRQRENARQLANANDEGTKNIFFIDSYVKAYLGDPKTASLIEFRGRIDDSIRKSALDGLSTANAALQAYVRDNGLSNAYQLIVKNPIAATKPLPDRLEEQEIQAKEEQERKRRDDQALENQRRRDREKQNVEIERQLRQKNGVRARGLMNGIHDFVKSLAEKRATDVNLDFFNYSNWLASRFVDQWETVNVTSDVADFGAVQREGRPLDAILVKSVIQQKNRILGKYEDACYVFGLVDDPEFTMQRELFSVDCDVGSAKISNWKIGMKFQSQWNAN